MSENDISSPDGEEQLYRKVFWKSFGGRVKGMIGGATIGALVGAPIGALVGAGVAAATSLAFGPVVALGAAAFAMYGMHKGMEAFADVGTVSGAVTAALSEKEKIKREKAGLEVTPEPEHSAEPYNFKMGAIGAAVGAAIGGVLAVGGAYLAPVAIGAGIFGLTGAAAAAACVGTVALMGASFGINVKFFKNLMNASEDVVEGKLDKAGKELAGRSVEVDAPAKAVAAEALPENVVKANFRQKVLDQTVQATSQGRGA